MFSVFIVGNNLPNMERKCHKMKHHLSAMVEKFLLQFKIEVDFVLMVVARVVLVLVLVLLAALAAVVECDDNGDQKIWLVMLGCLSKRASCEGKHPCLLQKKKNTFKNYKKY
uniref:Uncharacterized protein n=1 Tax=Glossina austeni TaxID=7395 RepID=A0A1A9VL56_GLOAU